MRIPDKFLRNPGDPWPADGDYPCPCCRFFTMHEEPPGTFEICRICAWEDDFVQFDDPSYRGGANGYSLNEAREEFERELHAHPEAYSGFRRAD